MGFFFTEKKWRKKKKKTTTTCSPTESDSQDRPLSQPEGSIQPSGAARPLQRGAALPVLAPPGMPQAPCTFRGSCEALRPGTPRLLPSSRRSTRGAPAPLTWARRVPAAAPPVGPARPGLGLRPPHPARPRPRPAAGGKRPRPGHSPPGAGSRQLHRPGEGEGGGRDRLRRVVRCGRPGRSEPGPAGLPAAQRSRAVRALFPQVCSVKLGGRGNGESQNRSDWKGPQQSELSAQAGSS